MLHRPKKLLTTLFQTNIFPLSSTQLNMKFPFPFKSTEIAIAAATSWPWPTCATTPRTVSFRAASDNIYKTINPAAYLDEDEDESIFPLNPESAVISGLRSERLFFDPGPTSSVLLQEEEAAKSDVDGESAAAMVVMDSTNPFLDFRVSMEEMVDACDLVRDWEFLESLLELYLRVNDESNHGYIVGAFVDLLISAIHGIGNSSSSSSSSSFSSSAATKYCFTSPLSFSSSSTEDQILLHKKV